MGRNNFFFCIIMHWRKRKWFRKFYEKRPKTYDKYKNKKEPVTSGYFYDGSWGAEQLKRYLRLRGYMEWNQPLPPTPPSHLGNA